MCQNNKQNPLGIYMNDLDPLQGHPRRRPPLECETALMASLKTTLQLVEEVLGAHQADWRCDCILCEDLRGLHWSLSIGADLVDGLIPRSKQEALEEALQYQQEGQADEPTIVKAAR
jgi:hypothetical protein